MGKESIVLKHHTVGCLAKIKDLFLVQLCNIRVIDNDCTAGRFIEAYQ